MYWHEYALALIFISVGILHFVKPKAFMRVMPLYLPFPKTLVYLSGFFEIIAGLGLLYHGTHTIAIRIIFALLLLFIPVHVHMIRNKKASLHLPKSVLWIRFFLQFGLLYWVSLYF